MKHLMSKILGVVLVMALPLMISCDGLVTAINDNPVSPGLKVTTPSIQVEVDETFKCNATASSRVKLLFVSADPSIATVDSYGVITGVKEGKTTVTVTTEGKDSQAKSILSIESVTIPVEVIAADAEEDEDEEASITTAPTATAGDIAAGSETALVTAGVADGGTMMYKATAENTKPTSTDGFSATIPTAATLEAGTYYVWYYAKGDDGYTDSEIAASAIAVEVTANPAAVPLTMEAITAGTITVNSSFMKFSLNGGAKTDITVTPTEIAVAAGDKVEFYGTATFYKLTPIGGSGDGFKCKVYGNIMSLLYEDFADKTELPNTYTFNGLFINNTKLIDASGLLLPAVTLKNYCYDSMFYGCSSLTTAPELPATTLATSCYSQMFYGCSSLTTAPAELPAMELSSCCYQQMFEGCSSLTAAPELPATTLAEGCYGAMFWGCTALTTAPELPATTLATSCYVAMFGYCTQLTTSPELKATTLVKKCYNNMFYYCSNLNSVTCLATDISADACTGSWLEGVAASGTFTTPSTTVWSTGTSKIPSGWTRKNPDGTDYVAP